MPRARLGGIALSLGMLLSIALPTATVAAEPAASPDPDDITSTRRGRALAAETAARFTSAYGVPTNASDLTVLEFPDGSFIIAPELLAGGLDALSTDGVSSATVEVGATLASETAPKTAPMASTRQEEATAGIQAAAAATWSLKEQACLTSLYVDSARLDSCYYIYQLINDGSTTKNFWALRQKGTAFEYGSGLHSAWVSGERTQSTTSQTWVDWGPEQGHDGSCSSVNVGVSYVASLSYTVTGCEKWIIDKTCNSCSPWMKATWDCNCWFGLDAKEGVVSRAIAYQILVSSSQSATPRFRVGYGMAA